MMAAYVLRFDIGAMWLTLAHPGLESAAPAAIGEIDHLREREPSAWSALFEREMPAIYSYAFSRTGQQSDAEDLAAQVFEQAWRNAPSLQDRGLPARAWLFGIARNVVAEHRRGLFRRPPALELSAFDGADERANTTTDQIALAEAISHLSRADAEVVTLRFLHGLSVQETADVMRVSLDAVKARQGRALRKLRELLGDGA